MSNLLLSIICKSDKRQTAFAESRHTADESSQTRQRHLGYSMFSAHSFCYDRFKISEFICNNFRNFHYIPYNSINLSLPYDKRPKGKNAVAQNINRFHGNMYYRTFLHDKVFFNALIVYVASQFLFISFVYLAIEKLLLK